MRKNTIIITGVSVIITATIAGTGYYLNAVQTAKAPAATTETTWTTLKPHPNQPAGNAKTMPDGRVAPGSCPPGAPTDPDVRNSRIRLLGSARRCATVNTVNHARGRQGITDQ